MMTVTFGYLTLNESAYFCNNAWFASPIACQIVISIGSDVNVSGTGLAATVNTIVTFALIPAEFVTLNVML